MDAIYAAIAAIFVAATIVMTPVMIVDHHQRVVEQQRIADARAWRAQVEHRRMCRDFPFLDACKKPN